MKSDIPVTSRIITADSFLVANHCTLPSISSYSNLFLSPHESKTEVTTKRHPRGIRCQRLAAPTISVFAQLNRYHNLGHSFHPSFELK